MVKKSITYFEQNGAENTDEVLKLVQERLKEGDIKSVVVASTSGKTGLKFARSLGKKTNLVVVSTHPGSKQPGVWEFDMEALKELENLGCKVIRQSHALSGLEKSFTSKFSGISHSEVLAESLKSLFCPGMKVAIECAIMALDGGAIPLDKTIAVGGTGAKGRGADTAIVALPSHTNNFFDFRVLEIIAKPFNNDVK
ncbi:MAG: hypothetical protein O8C64_13240 [Candidatus Methanoperedens sp.]|nr:hypothetical protein [Candidatus Methanoperedens sp.]MCZ7406714.1 hypothetical protein [Candidatus Methanoperedens sp.]